MGDLGDCSDAPLPHLFVCGNREGKGTGCSVTRGRPVFKLGRVTLKRKDKLGLLILSFNFEF